MTKAQRSVYLLDNNKEIKTQTTPDNIRNSPDLDSERKKREKTQPTIYPDVEYVNRTLP